MVNIWYGHAAGAAALLAVAPAFAHDCTERLVANDRPAAGGVVTARAIVELRDFGRVDTGAAGAPPFALSPDGRSAALILRRADPESDSYCLGVVVIALDGKSPPRILDTGGEIMLSSNDSRGLPDMVNGSIRSPAPIWTRDGKSIIYLRRSQGSTQLWKVGLDGEPARQLTYLPVDVRDFEWSPDGHILQVTIRPARRAADAAIVQEGRSGYLYDRRFWSLSEDRPRPPLPLPSEIILIDPGSGNRLPGPRPQARPDALRPAGAVLFAQAPSGALAWTAPDGDGFAAPVRLHVTWRGQAVACPDAVCGSQVAALWWRADELIFLRAGGPRNGGIQTLYRWRVGQEASPLAIIETGDALIGCGFAHERLICARETPTRPRTLIEIRLADGAITTLYDPNPEFALFEIGAVKRLAWKDPDGVPSYGDLVLPPDHRPGERHPLIIVQYQSEGFLRGGTGDEYPIHLFAAHGYAVLSIQRPRPVGLDEPVQDANAMQRVNVRGWADRRRILAGVEAGIDAALALGVIDPKRIGITGLSDGAATVQFALLNSTRIAAAAVSSCCEDRSAGSVVGLAYTDSILSWGYPAPGLDAPEFWRPYSLAANAGQIRTPLLIQVADSEYRLALETFAALDHANAPVEMYVFPDEHHVKSHPAHRLAIYVRNLAWFDFWLRDRSTSDPASAGAMRRWAALKARHLAAGNGGN